MSRKSNRESKKGIKIFVAILLIIIVLAGGVLAYKIYQDRQPKEEALVSEQPEPIVEEKKVQIFQGKERPIAFMIDNHSDAWPQAGLNEAYAVYEIIVEGGETRLMPIFKGKDLDKIGPVRSSRHYFLDYALENDAIYVHYGWSPKAEMDITKLAVNNINGITESNTNFWRVKDKKAPHNVATSTSKVLDIASNQKYKTNSNEKSVLNYVVDDFNLSDKSGGVISENTISSSTSVEIANKVTIPYSKLHTVSYEYNAETKRFTRYARNKLQTDWDTKDAITTKNIIIEFVNNVPLNDGENKDRQDLKNIGTFDGYYITNGQAIKIKCTKSSRTEKTIYKDLQGNEIDVNDGNTWFNICPADSNVVFE